MRRRHCDERRGPTKSLCIGSKFSVKSCVVCFDETKRFKMTWCEKGRGAASDLWINLWICVIGRRRGGAAERAGAISSQTGHPVSFLPLSLSHLKHHTAHSLAMSIADAVPAASSPDELTKSLMGLAIGSPSTHQRIAPLGLGHKLSISTSSSTSVASSSRAPPPAPISLLAASQVTPPPISSPSSISETLPTSIVSPAPPRRRTCVIFQDGSTAHRYIRDQHTLQIVERPERIRAVKMGISAAWARLEARAQRLQGGTEASVRAGDNHLVSDELDELMGKLDIASSTTGTPHNPDRAFKGGPFDVLFSSARLDPADPAVLAVHPWPSHAPLPTEESVAPPTSQAVATPGRKPPRDRTPASSPIKDALTSAASTVASVASDVFSTSVETAPPVTRALPASRPPTEMDPAAPWPTQLQALCRNSTEAIKVAPFSEIPPHLSQTDLYLSPGSEEAIFGALGAVCEGVDKIVEGARSGGEGYDRAFVAIRPPGHVSALG